MPVQLAESDQQIRACFPVMKQLRLHLTDEDSFVRRVRFQQSQGYMLAFIERQGKTVCAAGYRLMENLAWGRFVYVDDLVTDENSRSHGHGEEMLTWLIEYSRQNNCDEFHLDSGVQRFGAHRFYLTQRMDITAHHFGLRLK